MKLDEILAQYPGTTDQRMIADFYRNLEDYERMLLKKAERKLKKN